MLVLAGALRRRAAVCLRSAGRGGRGAVAVLSGLLAAAGTVPAVPAAMAGAAAAGVTAAAVAAAVPAKAASGLPVLVVLAGGESQAPEAGLLTSAGYAVTTVTPAGLESMTQSAFQGYAAVVIGDPSTGGTCDTSWVPNTTALGTNWEGWVTGNVAVLGTAPELAAGLASSGNSDADMLVTDSAEYAAAQPGTSVSRTGLYLSLDCGYATAAQGSAVPVLDGVEGIGAAGGVAVNGNLACTDPGTVNKWEAAAAGTFSGFGSGSLAAGAPGWPSPGCPVQETFDSWPAMFTPLAYDAASDVTADFTASDGTAGQPYVLLGAPVSAATAALAPSTGGEVPAGATSGGGANAAAPGVAQASAGDPVNTENGDFTQASGDVSIPGFGPPLEFARSYDSGVAQQQTQTGTPGDMGYGWTDNWSSLLTTGRPVAGDIYTLAGLRSNLGVGGYPGSQVMGDPQGVTYNNGNIYIADSSGNRVLEVAHSTGTQWGISMTGGHAYVVAGWGSQAGGVLNHPQGIAFDAAGDMYIADTWDSRIVEIPVASKTQWGVSLTADKQSTIAGSDTGTAGHTGDGGLATSALLNAPGGITFDTAGSLYIADGGNNRVQEVAAATGTQWGQSMTAGDIYTIAGSAAGTAGIAGDGGAASAASLSNPTSVTIDASGDVIVADSVNNRVQLIAKATGTTWGQSVTANDMYTIAGSATGTAGTSGDGGAAASALLDGPQEVLHWGANLYIADSLNNRVQEIAGNSHTEFGQSMTNGDIYTIAGTGTAGHGGDGGAATSATLNNPVQLTVDGSGNLYIADASNNCIREVNASTADISTYAGNGYTVATAGDGGPATQASLYSPLQEAFDNRGDIYIADAGNNRIQEIAAASGPQWGISMTGGDVYTVAGSATGQTGCVCDNQQAIYSNLNDPWSITLDSSGNLYIADAGNNQIREVAATTGTQWGQYMTAGRIYTIAGSTAGAAGYSGDGATASAALLNYPNALATDPAGDIYISDSWNNRVQEIAAVTGTQWGIAMTAGDIYTIAGSATGAHGSSGDGLPGTSALLYGVGGLALDSAGNLYIGDGGNNRVQELAAVKHDQWGQSMNVGDIYTVTGGTGTAWQDGSPAISTQIAGAPSLATDADGDLYIADEQDNRIEEIANVTGTQWGQSMTAGDEYTIAGSFNRTSGNSGDGGPATAALMANTQSISIDLEGDLYITDNANDTVREVASATANAISPAPGQTSALAIAPTGTAPGGITITQPGGAQVTFWAKFSGSCASPLVADDYGAGSYCVLPLDWGANLTSTTVGSSTVYAFTPDPESLTYTYTLPTSSATGPLTSETDTSGDTLTIASNSPAPGGGVTTGGGTGTCPSTASSCQTITSASGRALILGYNANGLVTSVTDPMNRMWIYAYNAASQLTSTTDPMGHVTSYSYGNGSTGNPELVNDLLTVTDPNAQAGGPDAGHATVNVYDALGRVTAQTDPQGFTTNFDYSGFDAVTGNGVVRTNDPDHNVITDAYLEGTLIAETVSTGSAITTEDDFGPALAVGGNSGGTLLDAWIANGDSQLTRYSYDSAGNVVTTTDPLGAQTTRWSTSLRQPSCSADSAAASPCSQSQPGPASVAPGGTITPPASVPPSGVTYTLTATNGDQLYSSTGDYPEGGSTATSVRTDYTLYSGNTVTLSGTAISCAATPPSASLPCATVDSFGVVTQLAYDPQGDLISESMPDGNGTEVATDTYTYNTDGEQLSVTTPDGNLSRANAGNYTKMTAYNADGFVTSVTQGGGSGATVTPRVTAYGYDANGNRTSVTNPLGHTTTTTYNADDAATLVTDPLGNQALTCYDGDGNVAQTVPAAGVAADSLTPASCPASYAYPSTGYGQRLAPDATTWTYDASGNKIAMTTPAPAGQSSPQNTKYMYDAAGNLLTTTSPPAVTGGPEQVTAYTYDADSQLTSETTGYGSGAPSTTTYCYDTQGNKTAVIPPDGNTSSIAPCNTNPSYPWTVDPVAYPTQAAHETTYSYDSAGNLVSSTSPATAAASHGATTSYTYDANGNVLTSTDPDGVTVSKNYNIDGLLTGLSYSGTAAPSVSWTYDAQGTVTGMTDGTGTSTFAHDPFSELTSVTNGAGQTVSYAYDLAGHVTGLTYPLPAGATWAASHTVSYGYDKDGLVNSVTDFAGKQITITSNTDGLPTGAALGSTGDSLSFTYDQASAPSAIALTNSSGATIASFTYSDAPDGAIASETDVPTSAQSPAGYTYDTQGRIASMTPGSGSALSYGYDASGNLATLPTGAIARYDSASELISGTLNGATTSYTYSADGERLTGQQGSLQTSNGTWDGAANLTAYSGPAGTMNSAAYDGNGFRSADAVTPSGGSGSTQQFLWDRTSGKLLMDSGNAYLYIGNGTPAEQVNLSTGTTTYLIADSLGSVRGTVNSAGVLTASTSFDAWGNPETADGLTASTPFGYAGGYTDPTGLIYLLHRYYDPTTGQFLSVDPKVSQTGQPYSYADDTPVNATDPTGQWTVDGACPCGSNDENVFVKALAVTWGVAASLANSQVFMQPNTAMMPIKEERFRIPDFYWMRNDWGWGWINEVKVGNQSPNVGNTGKEAVDDAVLLAWGGGTGENKWDRNEWMPVDWAIWWFFPNAAHRMSVSYNLGRYLAFHGINMVLIQYDEFALKFPRRQSRKEKENEVKDLESGNRGKAQRGVDELLAPCPVISSCPVW